jgi:NitT/TauT family transport system permease protein
VRGTIKAMTAARSVPTTPVSPPALKITAYLLPLVAPLALVLVWGVLSALKVLPPALVPSPVEVGRGFMEEARAGRLLRDVLASLWRVGLGYTIGTLIGLPLGLLLGLQAGARTALMPTINFLRSLSPIPWIPFAVLWFGIGDPPVIFLVALAVFPPLCLGTTVAVAEIPRVYYRVARDYNLTGASLLSQVVIPAVMPQVLTALRVAAGLSWVVIVAAEMLAGRDGLGFLVTDARNAQRLDLVVAAMFAIGLIGVGIDFLMARLTKTPSVQWGYER